MAAFCTTTRAAVVMAAVALVASTTTRMFAAAANGDEDGSSYCNCQYTVRDAAEEADCRVYGQLGDGNLIPWHRANQTCLDEWDIKVSSLDRDALWKMCPYANVTNSSAQLLVNEIKFNPSAATKAIQAYYEQFWTESTTTQGSYVFLEQIYDDRQNIVDCEASADLCWGVVKTYFTNAPDEVGRACKEFHDRQRVNLELEQSTLRIRLCSEGASTSCEPLQAQINEHKSANPTKDCSAFGLGPINNASNVPVCAAGGSGSGADNGDGVARSRADGGARTLALSWLWTVLLALFKMTF